MARFILALNKRRALLRDGDKGFTLIELLVVVIIIGILAAIAIPIYIGVQNNAKDSAVKSDLANAKTAVVAHATSNNGTIVTALTSLDPADGYTAPTASNYATSGIPAITVTGSSFCIVATSVTSSVFHVSDTGGVATGACP